jgi:hypothetical protein
MSIIVMMTKFEWLKCGEELHADGNAARNIWVASQHWLTSGFRWANCQVALNSGTLNANGEFRPAEGVGQGGSPLTIPPL